MRKLWITIILSVMAMNVIAESSPSCEGKVENINVHSSNGIYLKGDWNTDKQRICALDGSVNGISQEVCKFWASALQTALYTGKSVAVTYYNIAAADCASLPANNSAPSPSGIYFQSN